MRTSTLGRSVWFVAAFATVARGVSLQAQNALSLEPGSRIRVTPSGGSGPLVGTVVALVRDTLMLRPVKRSDTVVVVLSELKRLERSTGPRPHPLQGAGIGLLVGLGVAVIGERQSREENWSELSTISATIFGVFGALVGATIGQDFPTEGWQAVRVSSGARISVEPRGEARLALGYSITF